jgi:hypothetical protein
MKAILILISLTVYVANLCAQSEDTESTVRNLEQKEVRAVLARDTETLKQLWDRNYVVNNPENKIVLANADPVDRPVLKKPRTSFTREVEYITVRGNVVISMGNETILPAGDLPKSGQTVKRRYTNIWMKIEGNWKLVARHANEICSEP